MEAALGAGAALVNDVSALTFDTRAAGVVAKAHCPVVLMHHQGPPETMQQAPHYEKPVLFSVYDWLEERIAAAVAAGIDRARTIVDPGIGFGKTVQHHLDRKSVVSGKSVSVRVDLGGRRIIKKKTHTATTLNTNTLL